MKKFTELLQQINLWLLKILSIDHGQFHAILVSLFGNKNSPRKTTKTLAVDAKRPRAKRKKLEIIELPSHSEANPSVYSLQLGARADLPLHHCLANHKREDTSKNSPRINMKSSIVHIVSLRRGCVTLGRSDDCSIVLKDPAVSRLHAKICVDANGSMRLSDLNSTNGTHLLTGEVRGKAQPIKLGERFIIGEGTFYVNGIQAETSIESTKIVAKKSH